MNDVQVVEVVVARQPTVVEVVTHGLRSGGGDASTNTASSIDGEVTLFYGTSGKMLQRASHTGLIKAVSGVMVTATPDSDYLSPTSHIDCGSFE